MKQFGIIKVSVHLCNAKIRWVIRDRQINNGDTWSLEMDFEGQLTARTSIARARRANTPLLEAKNLVCMSEVK